MTTRVPRLWQPGCPRPRVFLADFWMKLVEQPKKGCNRLPKYAATFEVDLRMSRLDVREYLQKIYKYPVREVRTFVKMGDITWDYPKDVEKRRALWKEEDRKMAIVFFRKDFVVEFPQLAGTEDEGDSQLEKLKKMTKEDLNLFNRKYLNKYRAGSGEMLPV